MHPLTEYFLWYIPDERTGELRLTKFKLSRADADVQARLAELKAAHAALPLPAQVGRKLGIRVTSPR